MKEGSIVPRRGNVPKREILPDPVYGSVLVMRLVNSVMLDGKKGVAQKVVYAAFDQIKEKTEALTEKFHIISTKLYQQAQNNGTAGADGAAGAGPQGGAAGAQSGPADDNVVDADYEVVDDDKDK